MINSASVLKPPELEAGRVEEPWPSLLDPVKPRALARKEPSELRLGRSEEVRL